MNKLRLIDTVLDSVDDLGYRDSTVLDAIVRRTKMIITNLFGNTSEYLADLEKIDFYPIIAPSSDDWKRESWSSGVSKLRNLLNTMKEEVSLFTDVPGSVLEEQGAGAARSSATSDSVFIVHGNDAAMKEAAARIVTKLGLRPIILHEQPHKGRTIIEKFVDYSDVGFAIVLLSPDDKCFQQEGDQEAVRFRARQNVVLELGYFLGLLGRERVVAVYREAEGFEMPTDYSGVAFVPFDDAGRWQFDIARELKASGYKVDANELV